MANDGGPAFPCNQELHPDGTWYQRLVPGMSLRDWFAGQALTGIIASCSDDNEWPRPDRAVKVALVYADAMLKAREEGNDDADV